MGRGLRALVSDHGEARTFFCGGSRNFSGFVDLFDAVLVLEVDAETLHRRLDQRPDGEWGARPSERELVERLHRSGGSIPSGTAIDATLPLARVVDEILRLTAPQTVAPPTGTS